MPGWHDGAALVPSPMFDMKAPLQPPACPSMSRDRIIPLIVAVALFTQHPDIPGDRADQLLTALQVVSRQRRLA